MQLLLYSGRSRCCEPQIKKCLEKATHELCEAHRKVIELCPSVQPVTEASIILEEDPCKECKENNVLPAIKDQLDRYEIPLQLVVMLPYIPRSVFLHRLTKAGGPVHLKKDLQPFEERHACMVRGRCQHVRCYEHCHYSNPSEVLEVVDEKLHFSTSQVKGDKPHHPKPTKKRKKKKKATDVH